MSAGSDSSIWQQFFPADSPFQPVNQNDGHVPLYGMGRNQPDSLTQSGYAYWPETGSYNNQPISRPAAAAAAAIWSNGPAFTPMRFASSAISPISNVPPGFTTGSSSSSLNPQATPWSSGRYDTGGYGMTHQPDYLTGGAPVSLYPRSYGSSSRANYTTTADEMAALEEQFRDFKLKPKILTEPNRMDGPAGRKGRSRTRRPNSVQCVFCVSNGEDEKVYRTHMLKDPDGRVTCPVLRLYSCPICNNNGGDSAHTIKYCPKNKLIHKNLIPKMTAPPDMTSSLRPAYQFPMYRK